MSQSKTRLANIDVKSLLPKKKKRQYPSAPQLRNHHWFLGGLLIIVCSWVSVTSTASINTDIDQAGIEDSEDWNHSDSNQVNTSLKFAPEVSLPNQQITSIKNIDEEFKLNQYDWKQHTVKRGDTLGSIFTKHDLSLSLPHRIVQTEQGKRLKNIRVGKSMHFAFDSRKNIRQIKYELSPLKELVVTIDEQGENIEATEIDVDFQTNSRVASGTIQSSLFEAASDAGINDNLIMDMAAIFGWDVDFVQDIRKGDFFTIVYEQHLKDGKVLADGNILAAEFTNRGETFSAVRFTDSKGHTSYYSPDGSSMKGTFLKSPMKFSRVSSGFSKRRFHPVLKRWRAHKGVDYAASTGTPIRTTANGKVTFVGRKGGYGRVVIISHGGKYSTLYAHMSKFKSGIKTGKHIKQGETIGYVGSSGLATGPHLHYEFRVNGVHRNPLTYKTPKSTPVPKQDLASFKQLAATQLALLKTNVNSVASNNTDRTNESSVIELQTALNK
ncbi:MAG: peptidoglycan DD-metalloendopeptidase family protein [Arenicella sp.]